MVNLPPIVESSDVVAGLSIDAATNLGLIAGIPVVDRSMGKSPQGVGLGVVDGGEAYVSAGTATNPLSLILLDQRRHDPARRLKRDIISLAASECDIVKRKEHQRCKTIVFNNLETALARRLMTRYGRGDDIWPLPQRIRGSNSTLRRVYPHVRSPSRFT